MKMKTLLVALAALAASSSALAGGPLNTCNGTPLKYSGGGSVTLNYDGGGNLGSRTKAAADAIVTAASSKWTNVATSTFVLGRGADLPLDVTVANYNTYFGKYTDGLNPVIYDTDGSIIDAVLGAGQSAHILGFAGSAYSFSPTCRYIEGQAVINGAIGVSDATMTNVIAHELGHLIGLDHAQLDGSQGLASSNYPLMYPVAYRTLATLHDDDVSAVTQLYPGTITATHGTLNGQFFIGVTPVQGANIWAQNVANPALVYSSVSDWLGQSNGGFSMLLPPGTYTLHAEAITSDFDGGSSVGQFSETYPSSPSFQAPLYVNGSPMAPLTMGNGSPTPITIVGGCTANATFRMDGSGSVSGNCGTTIPPPTGSARLSNISTRGNVQTGNNVMIGGFIIGGSSAKTVVVRARGPSLAAAGITNPLSNPVLQLVRSSDGVVIANNDNWGSAANASQISASGYAPSNSLESAVLMVLAPGAYTAIVSGAGGVTGVGLIEVFEVDTPASPLVNISTRGQVLTGNDVMIGGFIIQGTIPQTVAIRARGPSLAAAGITNPLANPSLQLIQSSNNAIVATNDNWGSASNAAQLSATGYAPSNSLESAILVTLAPGAYTAIVSGSGGGTGVGIVEVFVVQ
jgi:hypothetical protein